MFQCLPSIFPVATADHIPAPFIHQLISKSKCKIFIGTLRVAYSKKKKAGDHQSWPMQITKCKQGDS